MEVILITSVTLFEKLATRRERRCRAKRKRATRPRTERITAMSALFMSDAAYPNNII
ncbi:unnamed protein product [Nesidiocoris tenuis]|uniref:Uncharacterized protein n=1 Tax=Nesidiocoris tenuis TaxID=355587 RepID=A0A6H5GIH6_9HEMI|nr:unnamed protein product [Nesidiocoris tenuis]